MQPNPYVVLTLEIFREQLRAARAVGNADQAEAFEAAIRSLLEDGTSGFDVVLASRPLPGSN